MSPACRLAEYPEEPFIYTFLSLPNPKNVWALADADGAAAMKWPTNEIKAPDLMMAGPSTPTASPGKTPLTS